MIWLKNDVAEKGERELMRDETNTDPGSCTAAAASDCANSLLDCDQKSISVDGKIRPVCRCIISYLDLGPRQTACLK